MGEGYKKTSEASRLSLQKSLQRKGGIQPPNPPLEFPNVLTRSPWAEDILLLTLDEI
jgi:hypothetical protein